MSGGFTVPEEFQQSFRRLLPYMSSQLRNNEKALEAILVYLKVGDEKLARVAIEAMNENQRLNDAALKRKMREEALLRERDEDDESEDDNEDEDEDEESADDEEQPDEG